MLVCYVSGHGFGHAVRVTEVVRALWRRRPDLPVMFRTTIPRWLFEFNLDHPFRHCASRLDVGAVQGDSLNVDAAATLRAYAELAEGAEPLVAREAEALRSYRPALILADIPALALDVAACLGIEALALTNFSWDWIYADYVRDFGEYAYMIEGLRASYSRTALLLRLPLHGDLSAFPRVRDIPLVARRATLERDDVRLRLGLPRRDRIVLLSFGGIGIALRQVPADLKGVTFVVTEAGHDAAPAPCRLIPIAQMTAAGVRYQDLVAAVDVVMTKPGYGIVAECIANGTAMIYTDRGRFAEYSCLVDGIERYLPHAFISNPDLYGGRWQGALEQVFSQPRRSVTVATNGADVAADFLLSFL
jgi:hypothetical protein